MGFLPSYGTPLTMEEIKNLSKQLKKRGVKQFINLYHRVKMRKADNLKWGDEIEYMIVKFDHVNKTAKLSLRADEILSSIDAAKDSLNFHWMPEYGSYMVEGTPKSPYGSLMSHFNMVESDMTARRHELSKFLLNDEVVMTMSVFPRLGCTNFTSPICVPTPQKGASKSLFFPDKAIFQSHPRFKTLTENIRKRRGEKIAINVPKTDIPFTEDYSLLGDDGEAKKAALPNHVYLDAMGFGMGCSCIQVTFQASCIKEARILYDQLAPLCPIMMAITANTPLHRGILCNTDCRWNIISSSVDCRTQEERGLKSILHDQFRIYKSRYDSIDSYLEMASGKYNDIPLIYDSEIYNDLRIAELDHLLAQHIAHLFIRDPICVFTEQLNQNDEDSCDHFEVVCLIQAFGKLFFKNIQSTNWQTMRFKPPPANSEIGWRVEFRPCELQFTDFENAAVVCFIVLLTRVILTYHLNFLIPISKVDKNMQNAQKKDAIKTELFWFRKNFTSSLTPSSAPLPAHDKQNETEEFILMTVDEIINGKEGTFAGLIPLINAFLENTDIDAETHCTIHLYLDFIRGRASGRLMTPAAWIRNFINLHPQYRLESHNQIFYKNIYRKNSIVTEQINYDLLVAIYEIQQGIRSCPELLGGKKN